jgi:CBS domain-containing protein
MPTRLREIMTDDVTSIGRTATIEDAARLMRDRDIGDVVVTTNGSIAGIVTDRDIIVRALADGMGPETMVSSILTEQVHTLDVDDPIVRAAELMREHHIRRVPVLDDGSLAGIVSLGDLAEVKDPDSVLGDISTAPPNN